MCGKVRHAIRRGRQRRGLRRRPGHRGRWSHRHRGDDGTRAAGGRRRRRPGSGRRRRRAVRRSRSGRLLALGADGVWIGHALHRHARGPAVNGYKEALLGNRRGRHRHQPGLHRQDVPRRAQRVDEPLRHPSGRAAAVPSAGDRVVEGRREPSRITPTAPRSMPAASSCRAARVSAPSTRWCPPPNWCEPMVAEADATIERLIGARR